MIIVTVELHSAITQKKTLLGTCRIANDGGGSATLGNYDAVFSGGKGGPGKTGRVERYPRKAVAIWNLVRRACEAAGYTK